MRELININFLTEFMFIWLILNELQAESSINNNKPLMIIGPSAVGKNTLINKLKNKYPEVIYKLPSYTTRQKRENEEEGKDYYFVTKEEFLKLKNERRLFGIQKYNNIWYASNKAKLNEALKNNNKIVILNHDIITANEVKDEMDFNYIAILPPSEAALRERIIKKKQRNI